MDERERMLAEGPRVAPEAPTAPPSAAVDPAPVPVLVAQGGGRNRSRLIRRVLPLVAAAFFLLEGRVRWATEDYLIWALIAVAAGIALVEPLRKRNK